MNAGPSRNDFGVLTPEGHKVNFDDRIGLPAAKGGVDAFSTLEPMRVVPMDGRTKGREKLDSFLHESLHLMFPKAKEKWIIDRARFLTDVLWKAGYRRITETKHGKSIRRRRSGGKREA